MANSPEAEARHWKSRKCSQEPDVPFFPGWEKPPPYLKKAGGKARSSRPRNCLELTLYLITHSQPSCKTLHWGEKPRLSPSAGPPASCSESDLPFSSLAFSRSLFLPSQKLPWWPLRCLILPLCLLIQGPKVAPFISNTSKRQKYNKSWLFFNEYK